MDTKFLWAIVVVCSILHTSFCDESSENKENSSKSAPDAQSSETSNHEKRALHQYHQQIAPNPTYNPNIYDPQPLTNNILYQQPQQQLHHQPQQHQGLQQLQLQPQPVQQYEQQLQLQQQQPVQQYEQQLQQQPLQQYEHQPQQPLQQYEQQHQVLQPIAEDQQNLQPIYRQKQPRIFASNQYTPNLYQQSQIRQLPTVPTPAPVYESQEIPTGSGTTIGNLQCQLPMPCLNPGSLPNNITRTWLDMPRVLYATVSSCWGYNQLASIHLGREVHSQQELEGMCPTQFFRNGTGYFSGFGLQFQKRCIPNRDGGFVCVNVGGSGDPGQDLSIQSILTSYLVGTDNKSYALFYRCVSGFADYVVLTSRPFIDKPAALQAVGQILGLGFPESEIKFLQCKP